MNENVAIVILNYNTFEDTVECVNSIRKQDYPKDLIHIVIVDNKSTDNSANLLKKTLSGQNIHFLQSKKNLGFANGNNLGILYAREVLHTDYVYLVNSDIEFFDENVLSETFDAVEPNIAVVAPEIINSKNEPAYLSRLTVPTVAEQKKEYFKRKLYLTIVKHNFLNAIYSKFKKTRNLYVPPVYDGKASRQPEISNDIWLPGCGFLLTPYYFSHYKMLYPYTFMYYEESILSVLCRLGGGGKIKVFQHIAAAS